MEIERRGFLKGLGAAIVALRSPLPVAGEACRPPVPRLAPFVIPPFEGPCLTATYLAKVVASLGLQVEALGPLMPIERKLVIDMIDAALDEVRPSGVLVSVTVSFDDLAAGRFSIVEMSPGTIEVALG